MSGTFGYGRNARWFCNDGRVVLALMEKLENESGLYVDLCQLDKRTDTLAVAIDEVCVEALENEE